MKTYKFFLLFSLFPLLVSAFPNAPNQEFERRFSKQFDLSASGEVRLSTRYGEVDIKTWSRNEVKVDVLIKVKAASASDADETFERIAIDFTNSRDLVSVSSTVEPVTVRSFFKTSTYINSKDFRIYYTVTMPETAGLETQLKYCDLNLPDLKGDTYLDVRYGEISGGMLSGSNEVSISYGGINVDGFGQSSTFRTRYSDSSLGRVGKLKYDGRYSDTRLSSARELVIDAGYEEIEVGTVGLLKLEGSYNDLDVDKADDVYLDGNYCGFDLGEITNSLEIDAAYGDIEVKRLHAGFERVYIRAKYIDIEIDIADEAGFSFDLQGRYADVDIEQRDVDIRKSIKESYTKTVQGSKPGSGSGLIDIHTSYGDISLY